MVGSYKRRGQRREPRSFVSWKKGPNLKNQKRGNKGYGSISIYKGSE